MLELRDKLDLLPGIAREAGADQEHVQYGGGRRHLGAGEFRVRVRRRTAVTKARSASEGNDFEAVPAGVETGALKPLDTLAARNARYRAATVMERVHKASCVKTASFHVTGGRERQFEATSIPTGWPISGQAKVKENLPSRSRPPAAAARPWITYCSMDLRIGEDDARRDHRRRIGVPCSRLRARSAEEVDLVGILSNIQEREVFSSKITAPAGRRRNDLFRAGGFPHGHPDRYRSWRTQWRWN